ncbi:hypothetical protein [Desulfomicrobium salsuginis]
MRHLDADPEHAAGVGASRAAGNLATLKGGRRLSPFFMAYGDKEEKKRFSAAWRMIRKTRGARFRAAKIRHILRSSRGDCSAIHRTVSEEPA